MGIKLQKDSTRVKNTPFPRGDFNRIQTVNWIMAVMSYRDSAPVSLPLPILHLLPEEGKSLSLILGETPVQLGHIAAQEGIGIANPTDNHQKNITTANLEI